MPMKYGFTAIQDTEIPRAAAPSWQHTLDTYASETNKVASVWLQFSNQELDFKPHVKSSSVRDIMQHQLLSERRFFGEFLGSTEPAPELVLPPEGDTMAFAERLVQLARPRLHFLATRELDWWAHSTRFFDVDRERVWIFWRRILHTAHHRTQLTVYLRLLDKVVAPTYGPTADVTWDGADPTTTVEAAGRR